MIDLHCHILHGIDDGAQFLSESIKMAWLAQNDGIDKIVATPHLYRKEIDMAYLSSIPRRIEQLSRGLKEKKIKMDLYPGAEVYISHDLIERLECHRDDLVINHGSYMLIEFPSDHIYAQVKELFFKILSERIVPIIAHPERNNVFIEHPGLLYDLISMGACVQSNSGSITGLYGKTVREASFRFLRWNFVHFIGSDAHNTMSYSPRLSQAYSEVESVAGINVARAIFHDNAEAVLTDKQLPYYPEPTNPAHDRKSMRLRLPSLSKLFKS
jgi:protein-tyrosine phosphatase